MAVHPLLAAARELTPLLQAQRCEAEELRQMTPEVHAAVAASGLYRGLAPAEVGGFELSLPDQVRVCEEVGYADPSVAWCMQNSWGSGLLACRLGDDALAMVFADPDAFFGFGFAPGGRAVSDRKGDVDFSGRWPVVSGGSSAAWFGLAGFMMNGEQPALQDGRPDMRYFLVPAASVEILDTWSDVQGLRGSGSNAVTVHAASVPQDLIVRMTDPPKRGGQGAGLPIALLQCGIAGNLLGAARASVDAVIEQASGRVSVATGQAWRDWPGVQYNLATDRARLRAAFAGLVDVAEEIWAAAGSGEPIPNELRANAYGMIDHAHQTAREVVSRLYTAGSIDALHAGHRLEQSLRDVHAMSVNWERFRQLHFDGARVLFGLEPLSPMF